MPSSNKSETLPQSLGYGAAGTIAAKGISFARGLLLGRLLDAGQLGIWSLAITVVHTAAYLFGFGYPAAMVRFTERKRTAGQLTQFIRKASFALFGISSAVCLIAYFSGSLWGRWVYGENAAPEWVWLTLLGVTCTIALSLFRSILQGIRYFRFEAILAIVYNTGLLSMFVLLLTTLERSAVSVAHAYIIVTSIAAISVGVAVWNYARRADANHQGDKECELLSDEEETRTRTIASYSIGTWVTGSLLVMWLALDRFMLLHLNPVDIEITNEQLGDYFIMQRLAEPLMMVAMMISAVLVPHLSKLWDEGDQRSVEELISLNVKVTGLATTIGGLVLIPFAPTLIEFILGRSARFASELAAPATLIAIMGAQYFSMRSYMLCQKKSWHLASCWGIGLIVNFALNYWLVPEYQIWGAAFATAVGGLISNILQISILATSGFAMSWQLILLFVLPWFLLLPAYWTAIIVVCLVGLSLLTQQIFSEAEKKKILRWRR